MSKTQIVGVKGRRVWDSRGRPTVEVDVTLKCGAMGRAIAPAGASRGRAEAVDLRDGEEAFGGLDFPTWVRIFFPKEVRIGSGFCKKGLDF